MEAILKLVSAGALGWLIGCALLFVVIFFVSGPIEDLVSELKDWAAMLRRGIGSVRRGIARFF